MSGNPRFGPEAARIRAEAAALLDQINHPTVPNAPARKATRMPPPITDTASRLLARRIEAGRTAAGWSRDVFATRLRTINAPTLGRIERCERAVSIPELGELAEALDVPIADLIATGDICEACGQEIPR
ncbi:MAG TPA: helix-turn-helix transcriptional regulator [Umezawaea sp.]|nr:helix-turn-helix transcriptional regulator [Umezawaea sp.]